MTYIADDCDGKPICAGSRVLVLESDVPEVPVGTVCRAVGPVKLVERETMEVIMGVVIKCDTGRFGSAGDQLRIIDDSHDPAEDEFTEWFRNHLGHGKGEDELGPDGPGWEQQQDCEERHQQEE